MRIGNIVCILFFSIALVGLAVYYTITSATIPFSSPRAQIMQDQVITSETHSTYSDALVSFKYPAGWKIGQYSHNGALVAIAVDPNAVFSEEEYKLVDFAPGAVWMYPSETIPDGFEKIELSPGVYIPSYKMTCLEDCPNPAWFNQTRIDYYIDGWMVSVTYANEKTNDTEFQNELTSIVQSFLVK